MKNHIRRADTRRFPIAYNSHFVRTGLVVVSEAMVSVARDEFFCISTFRASRDDAPGRPAPSDTTHLDADRKLEDGARHANRRTARQTARDERVRKRPTYIEKRDAT